MLDLLQQAGLWLGYIVVGALCLAGVVLSCLSISGTWLVLAAAVLAAFLGGTAFPGVWTIVILAMVCVLVEVADAVAGHWGVTRRGGSNLAGFAALLGGLAGMILGALIPPSLPFSFLGMLAGSFFAAYAVERRRIQKDSHAAHVAWGAVTARVLIVLLKVAVTLGMIAWLVIGWAAF